MSEKYAGQTNTSEAAPAMTTLFRNVMGREIDAISILIRERTGYTLADFAPTHPGGAVGRKLTVPDLPRGLD